MKINYKNKIYNDYLYLGNKINSNYFEGWYFKHVSKNKKYSLSFIIGISKSNKEEVFIQVIENITNKSYYIKYDIKDFEYSNDPFYIKIKNNYFSLDKIVIDIDNKITIKGIINYSNLTKINKNIYSPNIMGPFAYLTNMECNHSVISLRHKLNGQININNNTINFDNGTGYIEKDYGNSFPKKYIWLEDNTNKNSSIFFSMAHIPILKFGFTGIISILEVNKKQYRFASYYFSKVNFKKINDNKYIITVKQGLKKLIINLDYYKSNKLSSPINGNMNGVIKESLNSKCTISLYKLNKKLFEDVFTSCAAEVFNY